MPFSDLFSPVVSFIKKAALKVSTLDGKPGLSGADFEVVVNWVQDQEYENQDKGPDKHQAVVDLVRAELGRKLPAKYAWVAHLIVWAAYHYAQRKGLISA